jgi:hypothetical protein
MQPTAEDGERLVCAILGAQVAAIRDRVDTRVTVDLLWRTADVLTRLSGLVAELARRNPVADPELEGQCAAAIAAEAEISRALDSMAFRQAQTQDAARQMADCVVVALERLAASNVADGATSEAKLSYRDLAALYVSDDQREVHDAVIRQFGADAGRNATHPAPQISSREGMGP